MSPHVLAVALTPAECELLIRAVRELAEREDSLQAFDVLAMLENALHPEAVGALNPKGRI